MSDPIDRDAAIAALKDADLAFGYGRAVDAIRALPAVEVGVKPLEWMHLDKLPAYEIWEVLTIFGRYKVQQASGYAYALLVYPSGTISQPPTLEAAKAAAQADYAARIRSALTVTPAPDAGKVQALVDALKALLQSVCGPTGFAEAVRHNSGNAYPWCSLDAAEEQARAALAAMKDGK